MHIPPPAFMVLAIIGIHYGREVFPQLSFSFAEQQLVSIVLIIVGLVMAIVAVLAFRKADTTIHPHKLADTSGLVTGGLYRYSRNPMYLAMVIIIIGSGLLMGSFLAIPAAIIFVLVINKLQIEPEERILEEKFGDKYRAFMLRTRRWI